MIHAHSLSGAASSFNRYLLASPRPSHHAPTLASRHSLTWRGGPSLVPVYYSDIFVLMRRAESFYYKVVIVLV